VETDNREESEKEEEQPGVCVVVDFNIQAHDHDGSKEHNHHQLTKGETNRAESLGVVGGSPLGIFLEVSELGGSLEGTLVALESLKDGRSVAETETVMKDNEKRHQLHTLRVSEIQLRGENDQRRTNSDDSGDSEDVVSSTVRGEEEQAHGDEKVEEHKRVDTVSEEVNGSFDLLNVGKNLRVPHTLDKLEGSLHGSLGPTSLLLLEGGDRERDLGVDNDVAEVVNLPSLELSAVREIEILGEGISRPVSSFLDTLTAPDTSSSVEVEGEVAGALGVLLNNKVTVVADGLQLGEEGVIIVEMSPTSLNTSDVGLGETRNSHLEELGLRDKVGIEDGKELSASLSGSNHEGTSLEVGTRTTSEMSELDLGGLSETLDAFGNNLGGSIGRVIENLDLELLRRIVELQTALDETLNDVAFVVNGKLDSDGRPGLVSPCLESALGLALTGGRGHGAEDQVEGVEAVDTKTNLDRGGNNEQETRDEAMLGGEVSSVPRRENGGDRDGSEAAGERLKVNKDHN